MYILSDGRVDGVRQPIEEYMAMSGFTIEEWGVENAMSLDVFCLVILLFFLFGLAVSASEEEYGYPRASRTTNLLRPEEEE